MVEFARSMRERRRTDWILVTLLLLPFSFPAPALAERGALTLEVSAGGSLQKAPVPGSSTPGIKAFAPAAEGRLALFFAPTHTLEVGVALTASSGSSRRFDGITFLGREGTYLETLSWQAAWALLRVAGGGLISRVFLEVGPGLRIFRHARRELLRPPISPSTAFSTYDLGLSASAPWAPGLSLALGWTRSGDRVGFGLRAGGDLSYTQDTLALGFSLHLFTGWSFYP